MRIPPPCFLWRTRIRAVLTSTSTLSHKPTVSFKTQSLCDYDPLLSQESLATMQTQCGKLDRDGEKGQGGS